MVLSQTATFLVVLGLLLALARPAHAFGAGNIASVSSVEGTNWRHGDIEDTLLTLLMARVAGGKKFDKMSVARVYFGNWLRDYSQAIDVGTVKYVSAEAIRLLLWILGFMTFGYGTKEFEVTSERLGCYRPEDHIDNPKDYADNLDAREYDPRLRGPVNERVELAVDERRGLKNYIASEELGITTSAGHVRKLFHRSIQLGRSYGRTKNEAELYEALRLLGTGLHCLEDWSAHSNYIELALIEMGERNIFPFVGRQTQIRLPGIQYPVYPIVTGTFGGVDFLHSVMGEFDDKTTQSELQQLENTMNDGSQADNSLLKDLLSKIPSSFFSSGNDPAAEADKLEASANAARLHNVHVTPKRPEAITQQMLEIQRQIMPILQWHDDIMRTIAEAIESIPVLPDLIEKLEDQINIFVFSLLAPFMLPVINQLKVELNQGSSEIIQSSKDKQLNVFRDDHATDPTHSMLSKDHFSDILNEPAGKIASDMVRWVVPRLMQCWDDQRVDPERTINRIINGVFHHPALHNVGDDGAVDGRRIMFGALELWWRGANQQELRRQLSRGGIEQGLNHKPGQQDTGHGCGKPLGMAKHSTGDGASGGVLGTLFSALGGGAAATSIGQGYGKPTRGASQMENLASSALGGGAFGGIIGAAAGALGSGLLDEVLGGGERETSTYTQQYQSPGGGLTQSYTEYGKTQAPYGQQPTYGQQPAYGQAQYQQTQYPDGGQRTEYKQYGQSGPQQAGFGFEQRSENRSTYGGGYERRQESSYQAPGGSFREDTIVEGRTGAGEFYREERVERPAYGRGDGEYGRDAGGYGGRGRQEQEGYINPPRQEYGGRTEYEELARQEYGRRSEYVEPPREEYGRRPEYVDPPREEYVEPPRREYDRGFEGGYGRDEVEEEYREEGREEEREEIQEEYREEEREEIQEEIQEEYREEEREERSGGWGF